MEKFPDDVTADILSRLPVKPLLRFRRVSKPFRALIDHPDFVKLHLNRSLKTKTNHKLILLHSSIDSVDLYSLDPTQELHHPLIPSPFGIKILGSVNGLICLINGEKDIVIWNLGTKRYQRLLQSDIEFPPAPPRASVFCNFIIYGFGYDSVSDDYKLLRLVQFYSVESGSYEGDGYSSFDTEAKVYSLRSKSWQKIQVFPYYLRYRRGHGVLVSSALHWVVSHTYESATDNLIAAFDLATNAYMLVARPNNLEEGFHMNVWELGGCLCVTCNYFHERVDLWVMSNYGDGDSWNKLYSISQPDAISSFDVTPLAYSRSGDEIMLVQDNRKRFWYNLKEESVRFIEVFGFPDYFESAICMESLVHLSGKAEEYANKRRRKKRRGKKRFGEL